MRQESASLSTPDRSLENLELRIAQFLRFGVILAGVFMFVGWVAHLHWQGNALAPFHDYVTLPLQQRLAEVWQARQWGALLSYAGLFVLISLPMLRVLMTAVLFVKQGEFILAAVAGFVLVALVCSFCLGLEI